MTAERGSESSETAARPAAGAPGAADHAPPPSDLDLETYFQPFYNLRSGQLQGVEALARRRVRDAQGDHTEGPADFFADVQASGRMREIDLRLLDAASAQVAAWRRGDAWRELIVSVNLSLEVIGHPDVVRDVTGALKRHGLPGDRLLIDIPTAAFRQLCGADPEALARLGELQEREIALCLDGFTAADLDVLAAAAAMPIDIITLHPRQLAAGTRAELATLAGAVQEAGLPVVAAGVETDEQLDLVRELGFEWAQGFLLGEPVPASDVLSHPPRLVR